MSTAVLPVSGPVTNPYGRNGHKGIDWGVPVGTPVKANRDGVVAVAGYDTNLPSFGIHARISSPGSLLLIYGHLSRLTVKVGDRVTAGQVIGYSGDTGTSSGPHLHFEVRHRNFGPLGHVNPAPYLSGAAGPVPGGSPLDVVTDPVGKVGQGVIDAAGGVVGGLDALGKFFGALGERGTWVRVLQVVGGAALVVGGVVIVGRGVIQDVAVSALPGGPVLKAAAGAVK